MRTLIVAVALALCVSTALSVETKTEAEMWPFNETCSGGKTACDAEACAWNTKEVVCVIAGKMKQSACDDDAEPCEEEEGCCVPAGAEEKLKLNEVCSEENITANKEHITKLQSEAEQKAAVSADTNKAEDEEAANNEENAALGFLRRTVRDIGIVKSDDAKAEKEAKKASLLADKAFEEMESVCEENKKDKSGNMCNIESEAPISVAVAELNKAKEVYKTVDMAYQRQEALKHVECQTQSTLGFLTGAFKKKTAGCTDAEKALEEPKKEQEGAKEALKHSHAAVKELARICKRAIHLGQLKKPAVAKEATEEPTKTQEEATTKSLTDESSSDSNSESVLSALKP